MRCSCVPQIGWVAEGVETGTPFNDVNLTEKVSCT